MDQDNLTRVRAIMSLFGLTISEVAKAGGASRPYLSMALAGILAHGFLDAEGTYLTTSLHRGVWLSDRPLDDNEGADGDVLLRLEIPEDAVVRHEWVEAGKTYREFLVPAATVNTYGPPRVVDD